MSRKRELGVGALVLAAAGLLAWMTLRVGNVQVGDRIEATAVFEDAAGLKEGAAVSIAGVEVGTVTSLTVDFDKARVGLSIDPDAQVRDDVVVALRARSVLGEKYIELLPQDPSAPLLTSGATLTRTEGQLEIDQFVNQLGPLLDGVDPETLDAVLDPWLAALEEDPERPTRMLDDAEVLLRNLREASEDAPAMVSEARGTLSEVRSLAQDGKKTLDRADAVLSDLEDATAELPASAERIPGLLDEVEATVDDTHALVLELNGQTDQVEVILDNLEEIDKWELRRIVREEGVTVRLRPREIEEE